jgi:hypothetical protein
VTSGGTLDTGILATTGALNITSTNGGVNINTRSTTRRARSPSPRPPVNINESITNLRAAATAITAGTPYNCWRRSTVATVGGAVTVTAGNDVSVIESIATNSAASFTATGGSVTLQA